MSTLDSPIAKLAAGADLQTLLASWAGELTDRELEQIAAGKQLGEGLARVGSGIGTGIGQGFGRLLGGNRTP